MATRAGRCKQIVTAKGLVLPKNKLFLVIGRGIALKGRLRRGGS